MVRRLVFALICVAAPLLVLAQSNPGFVTNQIPTAAQWAAAFAGKVDTNGGTCTNCTFTLPTVGAGTFSGNNLFNGAVNTFGSVAAASTAGAVVVNANTATAPVVPHPEGAIHIVGLDANDAGLYVDTFGGSNVRSIINLRNAEGTGAVPTATVSGDELGRISGRGYNGSAFTNSVASVSFMAAQNYTTSNQGASIAFRTTALNTQGGGTSTVPPIVVTVEPSGGLAVGNATFNATDPGNGVVAALTSFKIGTIYSAAGTPLPTCNGGAEGTWAAVSDATAPTYHAAYTSGGTVHAPVYCDGTSWKTE